MPLSMLHVEGDRVGMPGCAVVVIELPVHHHLILS